MLHSIRGRVGFAPTGLPSISTLRDADAERRIAAALCGIPAAAPSTALPRRRPVHLAAASRWEAPSLEMLERVRQGLLHLAGDAPANGCAEPDADPAQWRDGWADQGVRLNATGASIIERLRRAPDTSELVVLAVRLVVDGANPAVVELGMRAYDERVNPPKAQVQV